MGYIRSYIIQLLAVKQLSVVSEVEKMNIFIKKIYIYTYTLKSYVLNHLSLKFKFRVYK